MKQTNKFCSGDTVRLKGTQYYFKCLRKAILPFHYIVKCLGTNELYLVYDNDLEKVSKTQLKLLENLQSK